MAHSDSESSSASVSLVASIATQPHLPPPQPQPIVFTISNMNQNLHIKLSKGNFMAWRTQIFAYIKGQDTYGILDGSSRPPQTILNPSTDVGAPATIVNPEFLA